MYLPLYCFHYYFYYRCYCYYYYYYFCLSDAAAAATAVGSCESQSKWFDFDDLTVQSINEEDIEQQFEGEESAYMLFYRLSSLHRPLEGRLLLFNYSSCFTHSTLKPT